MYNVNKIEEHIDFTVCITRLLAINMSIPNLTVTRLEQFRSPQLRTRENDQQT